MEPISQYINKKIYEYGPQPIISKSVHLNTDFYEVQ